MATTESEAPVETVEPDEAATPEADDAPLGEAGKKALDAERAARKAAEKAAQEAAAQLRELRDSKMTDLERAQADAKAAKEEAQQATREALRWRIAAKYGISDEDADTFLTGADEARLTAQAERLKALASQSSATLLPDPTQGAQGTPFKPSTADVFAQAFEGRI